MKSLVFTLTLLLASAALAAGAEHGEQGIPVKLIVYQIINVGMLVAGLIYFLKTPVRNYFRDKRKQFVAEAEKSQAARAAAELEHAELKQRLAKLEDNKEESISRAKAEAADMRTQLAADAKAISKRIQEEAKNAALNEIERAKTQLREELLKEAIQAARKEMSGHVTSDEHKKLQSDFISNIKTVNP